MSSDGSENRTPSDKYLQHTAIKVLLNPTPEQAQLFDKTFGCCRYLWNQMLSDEQRFYLETGEHFIPTPARYKKEAPFLKEVDSAALVYVHQALRLAFQQFFRNPDAFRHPTFKQKNRCRDAYTIYCRHLPRNWSSITVTKTGIRLPKAGVVKAHFHRRPLHWWKLKVATVSRSKSGKYFCSLTYEYPVTPPQQTVPTPETTLGLNYSLSHFYVDSSGYEANPPQWMKQSQEKLAQMQRKLSRMQRGSKNYEEQLRKIQLLHEHIANQRKDFIHKESKRIADTWDAVCVRDTDLQEVAQAMRLGNVTDSGFGLFRVCLNYKLTRQGKRFLIVDKYFPSAKTCHECGYVMEGLTLRDRLWTCPNCGATLQREVNAAKNIRDQGLAQWYQSSSYTGRDTGECP